MLSITNRYNLAEEVTLDTREQKRSWVTCISLAHPRAMTRRESRTILLTRLNGLVIIRSTGLAG
jgi:hypothetical protein